MKIKAILALALMLAMVFSIAACAQAEPEDKPLVFGNIAYDMADIWNQYGAEAFEWAAEQKGVEVILLDSRNSAERSVDLMQELIDRQVDGISIFPISPDQAATLIRMANEANIPITIENLMIDDNAGDFISIAACLYDDIGYAAIKYVAENFPGSRVLMVAGAVGGGVWETYKIGIDKALNEFSDRVTMDDIIHGDWATDKAHEVTSSFIASGREFDVVFANNDLMAMGVHIALEDAGITGIPIISTGGAPEGLDMIRDGIVTANMTAPVSLQGLLTFRNLWRYIHDTPTDRFYPLPIIPIDKSNLDQAVRWDAVDQGAVNAIGGLD